MKTDPSHPGAAQEELPDAMGYNLGIKRRSFVQVLGAGLLLAVSAGPALAQRSGRGGGARAQRIAARVHLAKDGSITVLTGKVEGGQGARAELTMAAAEELRVPVNRIQLLMADTSVVPDDGSTAGSRSTPATVPAIRRGAAAARELLIDFAQRTWNVDRKSIQVRDGQAVAPTAKQGLSYADLARSENFDKAVDQVIPSDVSLTPVRDWRVLGHSTPRPNSRDIVTGTHRFPSDISLPGMLYGKVLRPPTYGAKLLSIDLGPAQAMKDVVACRDGSFVGVAASTTYAAQKALDAVSATAQWEPTPQPSSEQIFSYLTEHAQGGVPANPFRPELDAARQSLKQTYHVPYVQHAPLEPRAAVAEWQDGKLTVWTGTQNPFGCRGELARAFRLPETDVRLVVPDFGSGFGGKHTGECGVEAARLAKAAGRPVSLRWTRYEEFTAAYFRPAAVIQLEASLNDLGKLTSWHHVNINSGGAAIDTLYETGKKRCQFVQSSSPFRQGSYRALAATANNFARECFMDELAFAAGADPLQFRLSHLTDERLETQRLRAVLETAAARFHWKEKAASQAPNVAVGLACGTEKGSYVAACVEIEIQPADKRIYVRRVCEVFECGAILNPDNLRSQVHGQILMGLGPALREEMLFEGGKFSNASFRQYKVPRFSDVPELDIHLLNRPDLDSVGGGETPILVIAPAIANAVFRATGGRIHSMPIRLPT